MIRVLKAYKGIVLIEILVAFALLSVLALPMGMFLSEFSRGSGRTADRFRILGLVEEKLEAALSFNYDCLPVGDFSDTKLFDDNSRTIDLETVQVSSKRVNFKMSVKKLAADFKAIDEMPSGRLRRARLENAMKRVVIEGTWGEKRSQKIKLLGYRANL